jgi:starch phosphorylase
MATNGSSADVFDGLPARLRRLAELAYNLWWSWTPEARELFASIDRTLWEMTQHNPVRLLREVPRERLHALAQDPLFLRRQDAVLLAFDAAMTTTDTWCAEEAAELREAPVAYFSAEFGIHNSLPIYSGGLGILAGDHCKEASDLGIPFAGLGFMYPLGYFHQRLASDGRQEAVYECLDRAEAPLVPARVPGGRPCLVSVPIGDRQVHCVVWQVRVGRTNLYLMDTDVEANAPWDRELSARLYGGNQETRIQQEIVLGIGGVRVLRALGITPHVWHLNEGHAAFVVVERLREMVATGTPLSKAVDFVKRTTVFTTHTPVSAGHDAFPFEMVVRYLHRYCTEAGLDREALLALGRHRESWGETFHMTVLALTLSERRNGVSRIHGEVSRRMWQSLWPDTPTAQVPIASITNGVHTPTWLAPEMVHLYNKYLGPDWVARHDVPAVWHRLYDVPDEELWHVRVRLKHKLARFVRERSRTLWRDARRDAVQALSSGALLDPDALTIGFARRFATYKRAALLFQNVARLRAILHDRWRPVQVVFAGKAHPADEPGQRLIQQIYALARDHDLGGHIAFVEDYDMHVAKYLVQGVDVWLNNPVPPLEASGTSGQKAALNGVLNLSVADGWWAEAYTGANGWVIRAQDGAAADDRARDTADAAAIYALLESEIVPLYYGRDTDDVPRGWIRIVKEAICSVAPAFSARRMLKEYVQRFYLPIAHHARSQARRPGRPAAAP